MRFFTMRWPVAHLIPGALALTLTACTCCRKWLNPARSHLAEQQRASQSLPTHPLTWDEFVEAQEFRRLPMAVLEKRFRVADADHDNILTPAEIQQHQIIAARNKKQRS